VRFFGEFEKGNVHSCLLFLFDATSLNLKKSFRKEEGEEEWRSSMLERRKINGKLRISILKTQIGIIERKGGIQRMGVREKETR